jgi:arginase
MDGIRRSWHVLGVPTSAAAHAPGLERGPSAWREAGLLAALGDGTADAGDLPVVRWRADRPDDRPNAWRTALGVLEGTRDALRAAPRDRRLLVLGGDCTLVVALVAAVAADSPDVGLLYVDGGQDLMIPTDHPQEPILDAMGVAHLLDLPGCVPELASLGPRRPLLAPADVAFLGYSGGEEDRHGLVPATRVPAPEVVADPEAAARRALGALRNATLVVHLDVDVLDALLAPAADVPTFGHGLDVATLERVLAVLLADPRVTGMTLVEANPDHDPDRTTFAAVAAALGRAAAA